MTRVHFINSLRTALFIFTNSAKGGGVTSHPSDRRGSKLLERKETIAEAATQAIRDEKLENIDQNVQLLKTTLEEALIKAESSKENITIPLEVGEEMKAKVEELITTINNLKEVNESSKNVGEQISLRASSLEIEVEGINITDSLKNLIDTWFKGGNNNNFLPNINLKGYYNFLDSLTLFQEASFLNILVYIIILCCIISITSIFFGNEIIRYLDLENKYPKLSIFFKLRSKYQRYYLMWNIFYMFLICIVGICLNLVPFFIKI